MPEREEVKEEEEKSIYTQVRFYSVSSNNNMLITNKQTNKRDAFIAFAWEKDLKRREETSENVMTANIKREKEVNPVTTPASKPLVSSQASCVIVIGRASLQSNHTTR